MVEIINTFKDDRKTYNSGGRDSLVKVIDIYLANITKVPFVFDKKEYHPVRLKVSPDLMRDFVCNPNCGGCCNANTLDYIPSETQPYPLNERTVTLSGKQFTIFTDFNDSEKTKPSGKQACKHLNEEGRCGIHMKHPFSCDFELLRFNNPKDRDDPTKWVYLNHRLFGRGWNMERIDGQRGALCEMLPRTESGRQDSIRKLMRLQEWAEYFELETRVPEIVDWLTKIPLDHKGHLVFDNTGDQKSLEEFFETT